MEIPPIVPLIPYLMPLYGLRCFNLFMEEEMIPMVGTERVRPVDLHDCIIPFDQALKKAAHESLMSREHNAAG